VNCESHTFWENTSNVLLLKKKVSEKRNWDEAYITTSSDKKL
jgi:hypothetical protein